MTLKQKCDILVSQMRLVGGSMEQLMKVLTDPVSNRILQMIRVKEKMTISEIFSENAGIPRATIYRKMDKMLEVGAIYVVDTNKVRGQTEHVYAIKQMFVNASDKNEDNLQMVMMSLMQIMNLYQRYFESDHADVNRDKLFLANYTISINDEDFACMQKDMLDVVDKYQKKVDTKTGKMRTLFLLSAPGEE